MFTHVLHESNTHWFLSNPFVLYAALTINSPYQDACTAVKWSVSFGYRSACRPVSTGMTTVGKPTPIPRPNSSRFMAMHARICGTMRRNALMPLDCLSDAFESTATVLRFCRHIQMPFESLNRISNDSSTQLIRSARPCAML